MATPLNWRDIPNAIASGSKGIEYAAVDTLNTIAFDARPRLIKDAERDLNFRKDARRALGWQVKKARVGKVEAELRTSRGWLYTHVEEGERKAKVGWSYKGQRYILVPRDSVKDKFFTRKGRIRSAIFKRIFIAQQGDGDALVLYRARRAKDAILIGWLKKKVDHADDLKPEDTIDDVFLEKVDRLMRHNLARQARRRR